MGRTDIANATSPAVTDKTWKAIYKDLKQTRSAVPIAVNIGLKTSPPATSASTPPMTSAGLASTSRPPRPG